ncbi:MAG: hypothetical protein DDT23_01027 [candidate division WS2 bacterium]|nr:hypothetical protein [Candidatus Lithacetigena glycinireducens]
MITNENSGLSTMTQKRKEVRRDLFYQGEIYPTKKPRPFLKEDLLFMRRLPSGDGGIPLGRRKKRITGEGMRRFTTGRTFREWGKTKIMGKLNLLPSAHIPSGRIMTHGNTVDVPQPPRVFPEFSGFGDIAEGRVNPVGVTPARRNIWGSLENAITQTGEWFTTVKRSEYESRIAVAKAEVAREQARKASILRDNRVLQSLPIIIMAAGIGLGAIYLIKNKRR